MTLNSSTAKNALAAAYATGALYAEASSSAAGATAGTALSGVARVPLTWSAPSAGSITSTAPFTGITAGQTIQSVNLYSASTGGTFFDTIAVTSQAFSTTGSYSAALTAAIS